jgi:hypothetical protein
VIFRASVVLILAALIVGCSDLDAPTPMDLPAPVRQARTVPQPDGSVKVEAVSARIAPNQPYRYAAFTHCGFNAASFDFDGSFWTMASGPAGFVIAAGDGNPPQGIDNPSDAGLIVLTGPDRALWTSHRGLQLELERSFTEARVFGCD